jgi:hypothetical protein
MYGARTRAISARGTYPALPRGAVVRMRLRAADSHRRGNQRTRAIRAVATTGSSGRARCYSEHAESTHPGRLPAESLTTRRLSAEDHFVGRCRGPWMEDDGSVRRSPRGQKAGTPSRSRPRASARPAPFCGVRGRLQQARGMDACRGLPKQTRGSTGFRVLGITVAARHRSAPSRFPGHQPSGIPARGTCWNSFLNPRPCIGEETQRPARAGSAHSCVAIHAGPLECTA